jgi:L-aspartate oxidase
LNPLSLPSLHIPRHFDVIVVGSGAAGLYASLCLPEHLRVGLITKDALKIGASDWAQGGIAAAIAPDDAPSLHFADTMEAGARLCDSEAVNFLVENAPAAIDSLVKMGVAFDRTDGHLAMTLEAAHSRPRVLHAADTTGRAIVSILTAKVLEKPNIQEISQAFALNLWLNEEKTQVKGISVLSDGQIRWIQAGAVILATGGGGQVFAQTTNPQVSTGDGVAIAYRAGAVLRDLEFFQFHPTALTKTGAPHFLISEAVRGEGAHLIDAKGHRFAFDYHPKGELAPRDVVSRAIFNHLLKTEADPANARVFLDLRHIPEAKIRYRFPNIIKQCYKWGIDLFSEPIPVTPAAHYWMGGIAVNTQNCTSISGLYAIGETASTGVHGANRLASNSLLECIVYAAELAKMEVNSVPINEEFATISIDTKNWGKDLAKIKLIREELPKLMWKSAGICRTQSVMEEGIAQLEKWRLELQETEVSKYLYNLPPGKNIKLNSEEKLSFYGETFNLLDIAELILKSANFRQESRGGHYRLDYPETDPNWQFHTLVKGDLLTKGN